MKTIDAVTLKKALEAGDVLVIDVREPNEYAEMHIKDAVLMPLSTVSLDLIPERNGRRVVIHCRSGKRSACACELLCEAAPNFEVYNLEGGILAWAALGYPVQSNTSV